MSTPIIRQGRYVDTRTHEVMVLTAWGGDTLTFNGNIVVTIKDFEEYFRIVKHEG